MKRPVLFHQPHAQEPTVGDVDLDFLHQAAFGGDTEEVLQQHHFNQAHRVDGGSAIVGAIEVRDCIADKFKIDGASIFGPDGLRG